MFFLKVQNKSLFLSIVAFNFNENTVLFLETGKFQAWGKKWTRNPLGLILLYLGMASSE